MKPARFIFDAVATIAIVAVTAAGTAGALLAWAAKDTVNQQKRCCSGRHGH